MDRARVGYALASIADGTSMITGERVRGRGPASLKRLARCTLDDGHAAVRGLPQPSSAPVWCSDIRAGAGLLAEGPAVDSDTEVHDVFHIDRGYPLFVENLVSLGAEIERAVLLATVTYGYLWMTEPGLTPLPIWLDWQGCPEAGGKQASVLFENSIVCLVVSHFVKLFLAMLLMPRCRGRGRLFVRIFLRYFWLRVFGFCLRV